MHRTARPYRVAGTVWAAVLAIAVALLAASPLATSGLPDTPLGPVHLLQGWMLRTAASSTQFALAASPTITMSGGTDSLGGLFDYEVAVGALLGLGPQGGLRLAVILAFVVAALGTYLLVRRFASPVAAALAAVAYTCAPLLLHSAYVQGAYGRLLAFSLAPYVIWGTLLLAERPSRLGFAVVAASVALTIAADAGTALAFAPLVLLAAAIVGVWSPGRLKPLLLGVALLVGVMVAAPAWAGGVFSLGTTGEPAAPLGLAELLAIPATADVRAANPLFPLGFGGHLLLLAVPCLSLLGGAGRKAPAAVGALATWLGYSLLLLAGRALTPAFVPREALLGPAVLALATLVGLSADAWQPATKRRAAWATAALAITALGATPYLFPSKPFVDWSGLSQERLFHCLTGVDLPSQADGDCPSASTAATDPVASPLPGLSLAALPGDGITFRADLDAAGGVTLPVASAAGLVAVLDGDATGAVPLSKPGWAGVNVPAGSHTITIEAASPRSLAWPHAVALAGLVALALACWRLPGSHAAPPLPSADTRLAPLLALGAAALLVGKVAYVEPHTTLFRTASPPGEVSGAAHRTTYSFGDGLVLLGYTMQRNLPPQGEPIVVTLYWLARQPLSSDVGVTVSLEAPATGAALATSTHANPGGIPARLWQADRYVIDRHEIAIPADFPPVSYDLRVSVVDQRTGQTLPTESGGDSALLGPVQVLYHLPVDVVRFPDDGWYRFGDSIRLLGCDLSGAAARPGDALTLTLFWRTNSFVGSSMRRFVDLVGTDGRIVAQVDSWAIDGLYPTDRWLPLHNIADPVTLRVPLSAAPGEYHLVVGLHDATTLSRPQVYRRSGEAVSEAAVTLPARIVVQ
ncbi:MAG: 6-pyruvoyl-tetrahydropterin synthase-related protein [Anaerolineae bacterium]